MRGYETLWGPIYVENCESKVEPIQISIHRATAKPFLREAYTLFPNIDWNRDDREEVIAVTTMQHALVNLVKIGDEVEREKDRLLENVINK